MRAQFVSRRINARDQDLKRVTAAAWTALIQTNHPPRLFVYGRSIVRLQMEESKPILEVMNVDRLRHELARSADWFCEDKDGNQRPALPPIDAVRDMLASPKIPLSIL